jgi:hypothetical protein
MSAVNACLFWEYQQIGAEASFGALDKGIGRKIVVVLNDMGCGVIGSHGLEGRRLRSVSLKEVMI